MPLLRTPRAIYLSLYLLALLCQPAFQSVVFSTDSLPNRAQLVPLIGDFNNDHRLDFAHIGGTYEIITVLLGDGLGGFQSEMKFSDVSINTIVSASVTDVNDDHNLDVIYVDGRCICIFVLLGNGDGTFTEPVISVIEDDTFRHDFAVSDFDGDSYLDLVSVSYYSGNIFLHAGYGNGSFSAGKTISNDMNSMLVSVTVGYINADVYTDVIVANSVARTVDVFFGDGHGNFGAKIASFTGGALQPIDVFLSDLNGDNITDAVVSYFSKYPCAVMFGYGNGTFDRRTMFALNSSQLQISAALADFNSDAHLDIAISGTSGTRDFQTDNAAMFLNDGHGHFQSRVPLLIQLYSPVGMANVGDFNGDDCPDIVNFDRGVFQLSILLNSCQCPRD